jgi:hypothetical protein
MRCIGYDLFGFPYNNKKDEEGKEVPNIEEYYDW